MTDDEGERGAEPPAAPSEHWTISRRHLLLGGGAAGVFGAMTGSSQAAEPGLPVARADVAPFRLSGAGVEHHWVRRREDGVALEFEFVNMQRQSSPARMVRRITTEPSYVIVHFPPQHLYERAFFETETKLPPGDTPNQPDPSGAETPTAPPVGARLAGPSRLVFRLIDDVDEIELTADELFDWATWGQQAVVPAALEHDERPPSRTSLALNAPAETQTAIELPWWLLLSPHRNAGWAHADGPVEHDGRTELWHTRLGVRIEGRPTGPLGRPSWSVSEADSDRRNVRAIWTQDPWFPTWIRVRQGSPESSPAPPTGSTIPAVGLPFRSSLVPKDRFDIVASSADYIGDIGPIGYVPPPIDVERLMLTPMGAWIDSQGQWDVDSTGTSLEDWTQRGTHGRDHYVRVIRAGFLGPFGHRCSLIKITERKFQRLPNTAQPTAYLRQRLYIVVRERVKDYAGADPYQPDGGRRFPFRRVEIRTLITPNLDVPSTYVTTLDSQEVFAPSVGAEPFRFQVRFTDWAGRTHDEALPLVFVDFVRAGQDGPMNTLRSAFDAGNVSVPETLEHPFLEQIAVAPPTVAGGDDTTVDVVSMRWGLDLPVGYPTGPNPYEPLFTPAMRTADVRFPSAEELAGSPLPPSEVELDSRYLSQGIDGVAGGVFLTLVNPASPTTLGFGSSGNGDRVGGSIEPALGITAVSRTNGVVGGDVEKLRDNEFDPIEFFGLPQAKLLGGISLADVIKTVAGATLDDAPVLDQRIIRDGGGLPIASETLLVWSTELQAISPGGATNLFVPLSPGPDDLVLSARRFNDLKNPAASTSEVIGELGPFQINLFGDGSSALGFIGVTFNRLRFHSVNGAKPEITADVGEVDFRPPLEFIKQLDPYLKSAGLGGLSVDLAPTGVTVGYSIALPSIEVGVFSMQNLALNLGVTIPFTGEAVRLRFGFCTREDPFLLTISMLGGGGFVGLALGADGVEMIEAALEVGAQLSLDIGVASGRVYAKAGIYFKVEAQQNGKDKVELTGYLRLGGELRIMGIVSLSLEFYLAFTYQISDKKVSGQASMTVEISVLVFSGSVTLKVERRMGGSNDPTFGELLTESEWTEYAGAFA